MNIPRPEHPRPGFMRSEWINLNGSWSYVFDFGKSGDERGLASSRGFDDRILVPFCPESELSGVGYRDFIDRMWYHRAFEVPTGWRGRRVILHFGAVDYRSDVYIDGRFVGTHWGGGCSFHHDITRYVTPGSAHHLVVAVHDDIRSQIQPGGKQSGRLSSWGCHYTRTSGIWQTVWLEAAAFHGLKDCQIIPDLDGGRFLFVPRFHSVRNGFRFHVTVKDGEHAVGRADVAQGDGVGCGVMLSDPKSWSPENPHLYDVLLEVKARDGEVIDRVESYAGMRKIHIEENRLHLNNRPLYLRFVLDQGYYPDGIWTAPSDAALSRDIELSQAAGFNGARLHQKVFEERFHYWADRLGYLTWGEAASWKADLKNPVSGRNFLTEWSEQILRDRNHPSIIAWTAFNESGDLGNKPEHRRLHIEAYDMAHALDPTRPVNDASGYIHERTDLWTIHKYKEDAAEIEEILRPDPETGVYIRRPEYEPPYEGQPYFLAEFGGLKWIPPGEKPYSTESWGHVLPESEDDYLRRLKAQVDAVLIHDHVSGYCYTQLTDVEQEQNGIYTYDRRPKMNMEPIRSIFRRNPSWKGTT